MINQIVLVGRLVSDSEIKETENGNKVSYITLAVPRSYKNFEGIYETDFVPCKVGFPMCHSVKEYCKKGDFIGIKGRMQTKQEEDKNIIEIVAESVTFLSSRKGTEEE